MLQSLQEREKSSFLLRNGARREWVASVGLALTVGIAYFIAARLSLFLQTKPDGVAVFWPAAGVSSGVLIAFGRRLRWPVAIGTIVATVAANLTSDRTIWGAFAFALCNAAEALFTAWLIEHYISQEFRLSRFRHVVGFLMAAVVGTAASGLGGAVSYRLFHNSDVPFFVIWQHWLASDIVGIITVAPLLIGLASALRVPPSRRELLEGVVGLTVVAVATGMIVFLMPTTWRDIDVALVLLLPILVWLAARCQPVFASAAAFVVSVTIVLAVTFEFGYFGKVEPFADANHILGAQFTIVGVALCTLILAALFEERRQHESVLVEGEARLQEALTAGGVVAFDWDLRSGLLQISESAALILGLDPKKAMRAASFLARIHPNDRASVEALVDRVSPSNPSYSAKFRFMRPDGRQVWLEEASKAQFDRAGQVVRLKGLTLDITDRKRAEEHQRVLMAELDHRVKNVLAGVAAVATSTREGTSSIEEFSESLNGRIQSMALAHTLLSHSSWRGVPLAELIRNQLAPYMTSANITIGGEDVVLTPAATQAVAIVVHELATNAAKYGALSVPRGRITVTWECKRNDEREQSLTIVWREVGGPPAPVQTHSGYGTSLIRNLVPHELGGRVDLALTQKGVCCRIEFPLQDAASA